jgi:hypothetical protein
MTRGKFYAGDTPLVSTSSTTPSVNLPLVLLVLTPWWRIVTSINNTGGKFGTGVKYTGGK